MPVKIRHCARGLPIVVINGALQLLSTGKQCSLTGRQVTYRALKTVPEILTPDARERQRFIFDESIQRTRNGEVTDLQVLSHFTLFH